MRAASSGVQESQVVIDLGDRADRRTRILRCGLLIDRNCRAEPLNEVNVWLVHLTQELTRIGRERLHISSLSLGKDRVKGQARLAGARQACKHNQGIARQIQGYILEVVLARAPDHQLVVHRLFSLASTASKHSHDAQVVGIST